MNFRRTSAGISNQHKFYGVDYMVYVEGGTSLNVEQVRTGISNDRSIDIVFWQKVFKKYSSGKKFRIKAVGSKTVLIELAYDIQSGLINYTSIAMDSEFDEVHGKKILHDKIYYTFGYSWENDVWSLEVVKQVVDELSAEHIKLLDIQKAYNRFLREVKAAVLADSYLFENNDSFFPKKNHYKCMKCSRGLVPNVNVSELDNILLTKNLNRTKVLRYGRKKNVDVERYCYGHLLNDYCYELVNYYLKNNFGAYAAPKDIVVRVAINKFEKMIESDSEMKKYYDKQFFKDFSQDESLQN